MDNGQIWNMLPAQKNIENMMMTYPEESLCNMGGYFLLASGQEAETARLMLRMMPAAHGAIRLQYANKGRMTLSGMADAGDIPIYECTEYEEEEKIQKLSNWMEQPFAANGPLYGFAVFHFADDTWYGCEKFHHLIMDKASLLLLIKWQRKALADIRRLGREQWTDQIVADERYWNLLQQPETPIVSQEQAKAWLNCHFSAQSGNWREREVSLSARAEHVECAMPPELYRSVHHMSKQYQISVESIWYLAFCLELCMRRSTNHCVIGRLTEYRRNGQKDIVGLFSRILPVDYTVQPGDVQAQCRYLDEQFLVSLRYGDYSLQALQSLAETDISFDIAVSYHPQRLMMERHAEYRELPNRFIDTPLRIWINDGETEPGLTIFFQTECYKREQVEARARRYLWILEQLCDGKRPEDISLLTQRDRRAYGLVNSSQRVYPAQTPAQRFLQRDTGMTDTERLQPILQDAENIWNYEQALYVFYQAVTWLEGRGIGTGDIVGLCCPRSVMLPLLMLAIQHREAAFLPVAVQESAERRQRLTKDCRIVITEETLREIQETEVCFSVRQRAGEESARVYEADILRSRRAYLLYTSGSTGEPKAVQISVYSLMCRLEWMYQRYGCSDMTLQKTPYTFDVSLWELLLPPAYGGCLYLMRQGEERLPDSIADVIFRRQVSRVHFVPSMLEMFLQYWEQEHLTASDTVLTDIFVSGEALQSSLAEKVHRLFPQARLVNFYGPTECTIDVSCHDCVPGEQDIPIGRAASNTELYIMATGSQVLLPLYEEGELCVFGDFVGIGYLGKEQGGYGTYRGRRMYRTGDLARLGSDGEIYYLGRLDRQAKLRGMRIDTGVVERLLLCHREIRAAHVTVQGQHLAAYYEADRELAGLCDMLAGELPFYNIPDRWYQVSSFPLSSHGKLDIRRLYSQVQEQLAKQKGQTSSGQEFTKQEESLVQLLEQYFPVSALSPDDNLLEAGLDSLTAMQVVGALRERGFSCSYAVLYQYPTVRLLASALRGSSEHGKTVQGLDYLMQNREKHLLLCVPYGGGESEIYGRVAEFIHALPWDMAVVRMADFGELAVGRIAKQLAGALEDYESFTVFGYCVGSALAVALAEQLQKRQKKVDRVYLAASLPSRYYHLGAKRFSAWDFMTDKMIQHFLRGLQKGAGKQIDFSSRIGRFRTDTKRYFDFMEQKPVKLHVPVTLLFGEKDPLTRRWRKKYRKWNRYFTDEIEIRHIHSAGHYFLAEAAEPVGKLLLEDWSACASGK